MVAGQEGDREILRRSGLFFPSQGKGRETALVRVARQSELNALFRLFHRNRFKGGSGDQIFQFRLRGSIVFTVQTLEMEQAERIITVVTLDCIRIGPEDGDGLVCADPRVAVVLIDQIQILELILAVRQGMALFLGIVRQ